MNTVSDRRKLRQEYLKKRNRYYREIVSATILLLVGVSSIGYFIFWKQYYKIPVGIVFFLSLNFQLFISWKGLKDLRQQAQSAYAPPVTPEIFPAEEILVRSSEEPLDEQSVVLLRATLTEQETPSEELLRPTVEE